jgi:CRISPR/Cas system Type II protein with McrA/HNH and RuvC-like nuclease domain
VLDFEALSKIETETVTIGGQEITMTMLVPADIEKCRKLVRTKKLDSEMAMEYMTFLALKKAHPEVNWYKFKDLNFKTINKLMAVMAVQNGFDETFQIFGGNEVGGLGSADEDNGDGLDEL